MTLTSTLFKGSRIKDGIWTCNNAGGVGVVGMAKPEHQCHRSADQALRVLLLHYESPFRQAKTDSSSWLYSRRRRSPHTQ